MSKVKYKKKQQTKFTKDTIPTIKRTIPPMVEMAFVSPKAELQVVPVIKRTRLIEEQIGCQYGDITYPVYYFPMGGHMPFPPAECVSSNLFKVRGDGIQWIDNLICEDYCGKHCCPRRKQYKANNYQELKLESARLDEENASRGRTWLRR